MTDDNYKQYKALAAYIDRIGAEQLNFRRFMVKEHKGKYYTERALIKLLPDGSIECTNEQHEPTAEEAAAIKIEIAAASSSFPRAVRASEAQVKALVKKEGGGADNYFPLWARGSGGKPEAIMVQQRVEYEGDKRYIPWTLFTDGKWRRMEPEGPLPFWKPIQSRGKSRIMIHEGAKAARHVDWMLNADTLESRAARGAHPWAEELDDFEHWGIIGGALAPHRADYEEIRREKPEELIYVCDNDWPGNAALQLVSQSYGGALKGLKFDPRFPPSFDLADPMPAKMWVSIRSGEKRWIGPGMRELTVFATRATVLVPNPAGTGRPIATLTQAFREEWLHSVRPDVMVHRDWPDKMLPATEFNSAVAPYSDLEDTARLVRRDGASKSLTLHYVPSLPKGIFSGEMEGRYINTHVPSPIRAEEGDPQPFLEFLAMLFPEEADRHEVMRWCATLIARPDIKILYGMLIISEAQGVGKTTLGEKILAPLVGRSNVSYPSESDIVDSAFNSWLAHKRLAIVNEIYAGSSTKAYNKLKSVITDRFITVNVKYQPAYEIENWIHIYACSNSLRAIQLSSDDRRWFVPRVTEDIQPRSYWSEFNDWLANQGGLQIVKGWAAQWVLDNAPVEKGAIAPPSLAKRAMIDEGLSPGMKLVSDLLEELATRFRGRKVFFTDQQLVQYVVQVLHQGRVTDRMERPSTFRKLARDRGWHVGDQRTGAKDWPGGPVQGKLISNDAELSRRLAEGLQKEGLKPLDLIQFSEV